ncbi:C1 family peptidase [Prevotella melaninogenica]|uniref:Aminopeptidase n=1 Tax=Prevotella melaninogenica TaxID=28132 RepID=A0A250KIG1_9BACT|nr:C1 family peptidase [Prevotella melaninogenica]BBA29468.1 aminopeptidase [Prevotella melaninogenica]
MKKTVFLFLSFLVLISCEKQRGKVNVSEEKFTVELRLPTTPVKDQGSSSLCWVYAMLATLETEHIMRGDSVNLSPDYVARMYLSEQASRRRLLPNKVVQKEAGITTRGMCTMALDLIQTYGLQHYDAYRHKPDMDYNVLCRKLDYGNDTEKLLDKYIGPLPNQVFMLGALYTPLEFAHSVCTDDEYIALTSFTHHPYGQRFPLEVPDNYFHNTFLNVPLDTMMNRIVQSLRAGHPVCWEGDISEPGFLFGEGYAVLKNEKKKVTAERRQASFEARRTTDDHVMEIVGLAHDQHGRRFFLCKNSWGTDNRYHGFMFLSENYVRMKTIAVVLRNI